MSTQLADLDSAIDLEELRDTTRRLLANTIDRRAGWEGRGDQSGPLYQAAFEQGWYLLTVPEAQGGLGQDFTALAAIYEDLGRSTAPLWLAGTMAAVDGLRAAGGAQADAAIGAVAAGDWRVATVIVPDLSGAALHRLAPVDAGTTHVLLVTADGGQARLVSTEAPGLVLRDVHSWDLGRRYVELEWDGSGDVPVAGGDSEALAAAAIAHWNLALAWDSVGAAAECLVRTVDYMMGRQQFGRAIASFQALKHRAADHKVAIELARSLARHASDLFAARSSGWQQAALQARLLATQAFRTVAEDGVQLHGGVGFTWEYDCHLFLKRALVNELLLGAPEQAKDRIAAGLALVRV
jgi:alkylation response protein AidB-like acyl-CoA dehydrogenase